MTRRTITVAVAALTVITACSDSTVVTNSYATYAEAVAAGAVERGWLPPRLPAGIYDIREAHDPETNRQWGLFSFTEAQAAPLQTLLGAAVQVAGETCDPPRRIEWWPILLRGRLEDAQISATGLKIYRPPGAALGVPDGVLSFAVNWNQRRAYYWSPG